MSTCCILIILCFIYILYLCPLYVPWHNNLNNCAILYALYYEFMSSKGCYSYSTGWQTRNSHKQLIGHHFMLLSTRQSIIIVVSWGRCACWFMKVQYNCWLHGKKIKNKAQNTWYPPIAPHCRVWHNWKSFIVISVLKSLKHKMAQCNANCYM